MAADITADLLVCGSCQRNFPLGNIVNFVQHKKYDCSELEFACPESGTSSFLSCQSCPRQFGTPWSLLKHAQNVHALKIYLEHGVFTRRVASIDGSTDLALESRGTDASIVVDKMFSRDDGTAGLAEDIENVAPCEILNARKSIDKITDTDNTSVHDAPDSANQTKSASPTQMTAGDGDWKLLCVEETAQLHVSKVSSKSFVEADDAGRPSAGLEKCCTAVVPKKRKRHMEIKHGGMGGAKRTGGLQNKPTSIFIDLEPSGTEGQGFRASVLQCDDDSNKQSDWPSLDTGFRRHSVIIQPGTTFSIPVSYAGSSSHSGTTTSHCQTPSSIQVGMADEQHRQQQQADGAKRPHSAGASVVRGGERVGFDEHRSTSTEASAASITTTVSNVLVIGFGSDSAIEEGQVDEHEADGTQSNHNRRRRYPTSRPFKCDQCGDSFNQRVHLKKHQSKHTGVKPFKCDQCDYSTVERSHLKVHIRVHTGEKPYKCTFCKYATAQNSTLKIHLKRHHLDTAVAGASNVAGAAVRHTDGVQVACTSTTSVPSAFCCSKCGEQFEQHDMFLSHAMNEHPAAVGDIRSQSPNTSASCEMKFSASSAFHAGIDEHHTYALPSKNTLSGDATPTAAKSASKQYDKSHAPKDGEAKAD